MSVTGPRTDGVGGPDDVPSTDGTPDAPPPSPLAGSPFAGQSTLEQVVEGATTLARGSRGEAAKLVQQGLKSLGFLHGKVDGMFGSISQHALQAFQTAAHLRPSGILDKDTLLKLAQKLVGGGTTPTPSGGGTTPTPTPAPTDAASAAKAELDADAAQGKLTGDEISSAEQKVAAKYGPDLAKQAMLNALGQHMGDLSVDAVGWLQGHYGSMDGHIDRYQSMLAAHMQGAKLLDLTSTGGKLDDNAQVVTTDASGKVSVQKLDAALKDRLQIEAALVDACYAMNEHPHDFAVIKDQTFNSDMWKADAAGGGTFDVKPGVKPSDAVADIINHPDKYKMECATAMVMVYYTAMLNMMGPDHFNKVMGNNLHIGPWSYEQTLSRNLKYTGGETEAPADRQLMPGDYTYFKNWDVSDSAKAGGWQGENVIYLGDGKYFGHPFGVTDGKTIVDYLNNNRNTGSTHSASLLELKGELGSGVAHE